MVLFEGREAARIELAAMTGAWRGLDERWGLEWRERRALFPRGGEDTAEPCVDTETRMRILIEIGYRLRFDVEDDEREWLRSPLEMLAWHAPIEVMSGNLGDLRRFRACVELGLWS